MSLKDHATPTTTLSKVDRLIAGGGEDAQTLDEWLRDTTLSSNEIARRCRQHARAEGDAALSVSEPSVRRWRELNGVPTCR
jgi:hypothetical protein